MSDTSGSGTRGGRLSDLANPTKFLALDRPPAAVAGGLDRARAGRRPLSGLHRAGGLPAGHHGADHVHPRAVRLAVHDVLHADGALGARHAGLAPSAGRRRAEGRRADRRRLHRAGAGHRLDLGQADVGHLVGVGRAADLGLRAVPDVSRHHRADARARRPVAARRAPRRSSRWSASSTSRSSSSRSTGGTRCTSRPRCSGSTGRPSTRACCGRCW